VLKQILASLLILALHCYIPGKSLSLSTVPESVDSINKTVVIEREEDELNKSRVEIIAFVALNLAPEQVFVTSRRFQNNIHKIFLRSEKLSSWKQSRRRQTAARKNISNSGALFFEPKRIKKSFNIGGAFSLFNLDRISFARKNNQLPVKNHFAASTVVVLWYFGHTRPCQFCATLNAQTQLTHAPLATHPQPHHSYQEFSHAGNYLFKIVISFNRLYFIWFLRKVIKK
jgi:hypothetical protein